VKRRSTTKISAQIRSGIVRETEITNRASVRTTALGAVLRAARSARGIEKRQPNVTPTTAMFSVSSMASAMLGAREKSGGTA